MRSYERSANPRACLPPNPTANPWLDRAAECERLKADARAAGDAELAFAMAVLAAQYRRAATLRRGWH